jgi:2-methylcitrate dehydratase PrpD
MGAAAGVGAALKLSPRQLVDALGTVGSMAGGIIEYLAEGAWTKRLHAGWAAQSGIRAALLGRAGFLGPRTVFEGTHGFFHGFAHTTKGDFDAVTGDFGTRWVTETLAFKPYPCGTMTHPYIDCARRLAEHIKPDGEEEITFRKEDGTLDRIWMPGHRPLVANDIVEMVCEVGEGTVHRLWEPLAAKQSPNNGYAGKFSTPYCIAAAFIRGNVGLGDFTDDAVRDPSVLQLAARVRYQIDPKNPYPKNFTGHIRATLRDGTVIEERQPYMRGGAQEPLSRADIEQKFLLNAKHGGWDEARAAAALELIAGLFDGSVDLAPLRG